MQRKRLFLALWPGAEVRARLYEMSRMLHRECGGRVVPPENLHLTLAFLGNVALERISTLCALAAALTVPEFSLTFGLSGYWRHHRIAWAAPRSAPQSLFDLVIALEQGLRMGGFRSGRHGGNSKYVPHVTLIRDANRPVVLPATELYWPVRDFALVESVPDGQGPEYRVMANWPLRPA